jgi:hypothetical protein
MRLESAKGPVSTLFDSAADMSKGLLYSDLIRTSLRKILPPDLFFSLRSKGEGSSEGDEPDILPLIKWEIFGEAPINLSIFLLCRSRPNAARFFFDMISRWLLPGRRLNASSFFATDFQMHSWGEESYTFSEIALSVDAEEKEMVLRNLAIIEEEIRLGVMSSHQASRILEMKGLSADERGSLIQESLATLARLRPQEFDSDLFVQMQHFLVTCRDEFKAARQPRHMSRIIALFYYFHKKLSRLIENEPHRRHIQLKLFKVRVQQPLGMRRVLALVTSVNFLKDNEVFEERHLAAALREHHPDVLIAAGSILINEDRAGKISTIYLEVAKRDGSDFAQEEISALRLSLPASIKRHIEHLLRPLFMPRNEEEVMRHIVTLSHQLKYTRDLPQVIISFDKQTDGELSFTVILLRLLHPGSRPISQLFESASTHVKFTLDRTRRVGLLRGRYPKEASVFKLTLSNQPFEREDHSVDLYKARQEVVHELQKRVGEVRDFNGGMLAKQIEVFMALKKLLGSISSRTELLLENFFHSLYPIEFRSMLAPAPLKALFELFLRSKEKSDASFLSQIQGSQVFVVMALCDAPATERVFRMVSDLRLTSSQLVMLHLIDPEVTYLGYIYSCDEEPKQQLFIDQLRAAASPLSRA